MKLLYSSGKTYVHATGLSCCFRQWRATSHCKFLHGYALQVEFEFAANSLDARNWVVDFGSLKPIKAWLEATFDHKLLIAEDDPQRHRLEQLGAYLGVGMELVAQIRIVPAVGCEAFAEMIFRHTAQWLEDTSDWPRVALRSVTVREHEGNWGRVTDSMLGVNLPQSRSRA